MPNIKSKTLIISVTTLIIFLGWIAAGFYFKNNYESLYLNNVIVLGLSIVVYLIGFYTILNELPHWLSKKLHSKS